MSLISELVDSRATTVQVMAARRATKGVRPLAAFHRAPLQAAVRRTPRRPSEPLGPVTVACLVVLLSLLTGCSPALFAGPEAAPSIARTACTFPAGVSANHRHLVDSEGKPYLLIGDSPQCLSASMSESSIDAFFADRHDHAFNAAWVNLLCGPYTGGRLDSSTFEGIVPFTVGGDLSAPNPQYFARMDAMVDSAARHGITLILDPAETGSFLELLRTNGVEQCEAYGRMLGERYGNKPNIIWMFGNDYMPDQWGLNDPQLLALARGIRESAANQLQTVELNYNVSTSYDNPSWPAVIDLATAYTYYPTYDAVLQAYNGRQSNGRGGQAIAQPVLMVEANYEYENNTEGPPTTDETLRRQEYWAMLAGAAGQLYGNHYTWSFTDPSWRGYIDTTAVGQLGYMAHFFESLPWYTLVPDQNGLLLPDDARQHPYRATGDVLESDYAAAAISDDRQLAVIYVPTSRKLDLNTSVLGPDPVGTWFDPTSGRSMPASAPFTTPGLHEDHSSDWVLVLRSSAVR